MTARKGGAEDRMDAALDDGGWITVPSLASAAGVSVRRAARYLAVFNGWGKLDTAAVVDLDNQLEVRFRLKAEYRPGGRPRMRVLIGTPGSGKSTYAEQYGGPVLSSDQYRRIVSGDESDQDASAAAFELLHANLAGLLTAGQSVLVDATNAVPADRAALLAIARAAGAAADAVVISTPLDVCQARNAERPGPAPGRVWGRRVSAVKVAELWLTIDELTPAELLGEGFATATWIDGRSARW